MQYNLIEEPWMPVVRQSGQREWAKPATIGDPEDPVIGFFAHRPDFNAMYHQFLIGLVQTTFAPEDEDAWNDGVDPPGTDRLQAAFQRDKQAFELLGDGPRFMQDRSAAERQNPSPVEELLLETPTGQTLTRNTDHFVKRAPPRGMSLPAAAIALYALHTNAPEGGRGHITSLRGGGPLTTLILGRSVWDTVWSNTLAADRFTYQTGNTKLTDRANMYPWLGKTREGGKGGTPTTPSHEPPIHMYWAMPRRIWLDADLLRGDCPLTDQTDVPMLRTYRNAPNGFEYQGGWKHPLTPHRKDKDGNQFPLRGSVRASVYRHWLGLVQDDPQTGRAPAENVHLFLSKRIHHLDDREVRLWSFGFQTKQNLVLAWNESRMPLFTVSTDLQEDFGKQVSRMILGADAARQVLERAIRAALFRRPQDAKGDRTMGDLYHINEAFWQDGEAAFYEHLGRIRSLLLQDEDPAPVVESWHQTLLRQCEDLFERFAQGGPFRESDPRRVADAWNMMRRNLLGKKVRQAFGLMPIKKKASKPEEVPV